VRLHVTNGDAAVEKLRRAGIYGAFLPWRDALHDGPVPGDVEPAALRAIRARFIADAGWASYDDALADFARRDETLATWDGDVALWFEHDLYDQLQVTQILTCDTASTRVTLAQSMTHLTSLDAAALRDLDARRVPVNAIQRDLAARAWRAFRADDPRGLEAIGDTTALPALGDSLARLLEELPSATNGLSRTERQALETVRDGATTWEDAFRASQSREAASFLGDASFIRVIEALAAAATPLLARDGDALAITSFGRAVAAGDADHVATNGVDRWLGGTRLHGRADVWRWDASAGRVVRR
jgi:hypothetical protein